MRIKTPGIIILRIRLPLENEFPNIVSTSFAKTNKKPLMIIAMIKIKQKEYFKVWIIEYSFPAPKSFENSGRRTWVTSLGKNINMLTIANTDEYKPASELVKK